MTLPPFPSPPSSSSASSSLAGHGVATMLVPLHVPNASDGLELRTACAVLVEVPVVTLLQQVLAATVTRVLVPNPPGDRELEQEGTIEVLHLLWISVCIHAVNKWSV